MKRYKTPLCTLLCVVFFISLGLFGNTYVSAETTDDYTVILKEQTKVSTKEGNTYSFTIQKNTKAGILFEAMTPVDFSYSIKEKSTGTTLPYSISTKDWKETTNEAQAKIYCYQEAFTTPAGDYELTAIFPTDTLYQVIVYTDNTQTQPLQISKTKLTTVVGQSAKLTLTNAGSKVTWKSSKPGVAKVSKNGKVTGVKAGNAVITATSDGQKVTCKVKVQKNVFSITPANNKNTKKNTVTFCVYKASYNSAGDLVCKVRILNRTPFRIMKVEYNVNAILPSGKKFGTKSDKQSISIDADTHKNLTITIPAKDLTKKNVNLRNSVVTITNPVYYYSYK